MSIPVERSSTPREPPLGQPQDHASNRHRILVVEDDRDLRRLNTEILNRCGYHVENAEDGAIAWDILQRQRFDLIVTDNEMPKVSGLDLLRKLYAANMTVPAVMATGTLPTEVFVQSPWLQPASILQKPYSTADLLQTIERILCAPVSPAETGKTAPGSPNQSTT